MRRAVWIVAGIVMFICFALLSYWLLLFAMLGLAYFLLYRLVPRSKKWLAPVFTGGTAIGLLLLFFAGVLRPTKRIGSCVTGPTTRAISFVSAPPSAPAVRPRGNPFQDAFRDKVSKYRSRARTTLYTGAVIDQLASFVDQNRSDKEVADVVELRSKLTELRSFLKAHAEDGLNDPEKLRQNEKVLEDELDQFIKRAAQATTPKDQRKLDDDFRRLVGQSPYFDLQLLLNNVQELQRKLTNADVTVRVAPRILFENDQLVFEEAVTLTAGKGELVEVDVEPLAREAALDETRYELAGDSKPDDQGRVVFAPGTRMATLVSRRSIKLSSASSCSAGYLSGIQHLNLRWPQPYAVRLAVLSRVPEFGDVLSSIELDRAAKLESITLPLWSYFTAKEDLDLSHKQGGDVLKHPKDQLTQAAFSGPDPFWIEVFRDTPVLRNPLVQQYRDYLIAENAISGLVAMLLGLFLTDRVFKSG